MNIHVVSPTSTMKLTIVWLVSFLTFVALMIFGIGWANNLGDQDQANVTIACASHPKASVCKVQAYRNTVSRCSSLADDASTTAGSEEQTFTAQDWEKIYDTCVAGKP